MKAGGESPTVQNAWTQILRFTSAHPSFASREVGGRWILGREDEGGRLFYAAVETEGEGYVWSLCDPSSIPPDYPLPLPERGLVERARVQEDSPEEMAWRDRFNVYPSSYIR